MVLGRVGVEPSLSFQDLQPHVRSWWWEMLKSFRDNSFFDSLGCCYHGV